MEMLGNLIGPDQELSADFKAILMLTWPAFWFCTKKHSIPAFSQFLLFFAYVHIEHFFFICLYVNF